MRYNWRTSQVTRSSPSRRPRTMPYASRLVLTFVLTCVAALCCSPFVQLSHHLPCQYNDPAVVSQIREATKESLYYALDTISRESTQVLTLNAFGPGPGKLVTILAVQEKAKQLRPDVQKQCTYLPHAASHVQADASRSRDL